MTDETQLETVEDAVIIVPNPEMDKDVAEYSEMENTVTQDFVQGLIKLGEILKRHKDKWKPQKLYTAYLDGIGRSLAMANQVIRIYEYSLQHLSQLLQVNLTNWNKVNMFLSLPDGMKEKLAEEIDGVDVSSDEFREKITEIKDEDIDSTEDGQLADTAILEEMVQKGSFGDIDFMAKQVVSELQKNGTVEVTPKSIPMATSFLHIERAVSYLTEETFGKLTPEEIAFWTKILKGQLENLKTLIK